MIDGPTWERISLQFIFTWHFLTHSIFSHFLFMGMFGDERRIKTTRVPSFFIYLFLLYVFL
jgi:hypothetical protein